MKKIDFTGNLKNLNDKDLMNVYYKEQDGKLIKIEEKVEPINEFLGNLIYNSTSDTLKEKIKWTDISKQIFKDKYLDINNADEGLLIEKIETLKLNDKVFIQIYDRIINAKSKK